MSVSGTELVAVAVARWLTLMLAMLPFSNKIKCGEIEGMRKKEWKSFDQLIFGP